MDPKPTVEYDKVDIEIVENPADRAWTQAEAIASDQTRTGQYKLETIRALFDEARQSVEDAFADRVKTVEANIASVTPKTRAQYAPTPEQAAVLVYVRDALEQRVKTMAELGQGETLRSFWETAIADGDYVTARVLADFLPAWRWHGKTPGGQPMDRTPTWYAELRDRTEAMTLNSAQKEARAKLKRYEATQKELPFAKGRALAKLKQGFSIQQDGSLMDGNRTRQVAAFRRNF